MRPKIDFITNKTWKVAVVALGVCFCFASTLAAQQAPQAQGQNGDRDAYADAGVPQTLTVPAGTTITGELSQYLSSHQNRPGDAFTMTLTQPLVVNGWVVARPGQLVNGEVTIASKGGTGKGPSQLGLELTEVNLVDGQQVPISTQLIQSTGGSNAGRNVATVATTTGLGAVIGAVIGNGEGAGIGAAAGAAAGVIGVLSTSGRPTEIGPESTLTFRLGAPVDISTQGSERAFLPVSPQDYSAAQTRGRYAPQPPRPYVRPYPVPYPYPYPYYAYGYGYPYYYGPNIVIRGGYRRGWRR